MDQEKNSLYSPSSTEQEGELGDKFSLKLSATVDMTIEHLYGRKGKEKEYAKIRTKQERQE